MSPQYVPCVVAAVPTLRGYCLARELFLQTDAFRSRSALAITDTELNSWQRWRHWAQKDPEERIQNPHGDGRAGPSKCHENDWMEQHKKSDLCSECYDAMPDTYVRQRTYNLLVSPQSPERLSNDSCSVACADVHTTIAVLVDTWVFPVAVTAHENRSDSEIAGDHQSGQVVGLDHHPDSACAR
jgi:hypothetical protein